MTQNERILAYMQQHGSITQYDAHMYLGVMRLASRINDLRKAGHKIITVSEQSPNRFGEMTRYARYKLAPAQ